MIPTDKLSACAASFGLALDTQQCNFFNTYGKFLLEYNEKVNLTAITDPAEIAIKHFADSIFPLALTEFTQGASLIDVGTGAGFPGVPIKIMRPDIRLTLLDSLNKRLMFLKQLSTLLGQENTFIHARAEIAGADEKLRGQFDYATSRAVAQLAVLCEYCLPLLKVGGKMLALKGPDCGAEIEAAKKAIGLLGGNIVSVQEYALENQGERTLIVIKKEKPTPKKYPRQRIKLNEKPL
ncbi:16S rRNA (guanine(527)-N(7))-methyltransferase RsmG [Oscillospiraceae bacterium LTW-04]|nr:16S rRNA (guanine(527)-N(7))-methyltransferase RsmG [Oscillospiraceae bacterium MB24-C1]